MFKKVSFYLSLLFFSSISLNSHATISLSAVSKLSIVVYGLYTTTDATCTTGWTAVLPFNKNATATDFATAGGIRLGSGSISSPTNCILLIIKNTAVMSVAAGSYSTTTNGNADSQCNAGLTNSSVILFDGTNAYQVTNGPVWPAASEKPSLDVSNAGSTKATSVASATGSEIIPLYLSVNSACTGNAAYDTSSCTTIDNSGQNAGFRPPASAGDHHFGYTTTAPATGGSRYKFVIDMSQAVGGTGSGNCSIGAPPPMKFISF